MPLSDTIHLDVEGKGTAYTYLGLDFNSSTQVFTDLLRYHQSEANPLLIYDFSGAKLSEGLEELLHVLFGDANTCVSHLDLQDHFIVGSGFIIAFTLLFVFNILVFK